MLFNMHLISSKVAQGKEPGAPGDTGLILGSGRSSGDGNGHSLSILAWRIPWTEEPGRLLSMGSQRVGHIYLEKY